MPSDTSDGNARPVKTYAEYITELRAQTESLHISTGMLHDRLAELKREEKSKQKLRKRVKGWFTQLGTSKDLHDSENDPSVQSFRHLLAEIESQQDQCIQEALDLNEGYVKYDCSLKEVSEGRRRQTRTTSFLLLSVSEPGNHLISSIWPPSGNPIMMPPINTYSVNDIQTTMNIRNQTALFSRSVTPEVETPGSVSFWDGPNFSGALSNHRIAIVFGGTIPEGHFAKISYTVWEDGRCLERTSFVLAGVSWAINSVSPRYDRDYQGPRTYSHTQPAMVNLFP